MSTNTSFTLSNQHLKLHLTPVKKFPTLLTTNKNTPLKRKLSETNSILNQNSPSQSKSNTTIEKTNNSFNKENINTSNTAAPNFDSHFNDNYQNDMINDNDDECEIIDDIKPSTNKKEQDDKGQFKMPGSASKKRRLLIGKSVEKVPELTMSTIERQVDSFINEAAKSMNKNSASYNNNNNARLPITIRPNIITQNNNQKFEQQILFDMLNNSQPRSQLIQNQPKNDIVIIPTQHNFAHSFPIQHPQTQLQQQQQQPPQLYFDIATGQLTAGSPMGTPLLTNPALKNLFTQQQQTQSQGQTPILIIQPNPQPKAKNINNNTNNIQPLIQNTPNLPSNMPINQYPDTRPPEKTARVVAPVFSSPNTAPARSCLTEVLPSKELKKIQPAPVDPVPKYLLTQALMNSDNNNYRLSGIIGNGLNSSSTKKSSQTPNYSDKPIQPNLSTADSALSSLGSERPKRKYRFIRRRPAGGSQEQEHDLNSNSNSPDKACFNCDSINNSQIVAGISGTGPLGGEIDLLELLSKKDILEGENNQKKKRSYCTPKIRSLIDNNLISLEGDGITNNRFLTAEYLSNPISFDDNSNGMSSNVSIETCLTVKTVKTNVAVESRDIHDEIGDIFDFACVKSAQAPNRGGYGDNDNEDDNSNDLSLEDILIKSKSPRKRVNNDENLNHQEFSANLQSESNTSLTSSSSPSKAAINNLRRSTRFMANLKSSSQTKTENDDSDCSDDFDMLFSDLNLSKLKQKQKNTESDEKAASEAQNTSSSNTRMLRSRTNSRLNK